MPVHYAMETIGDLVYDEADAEDIPLDEAWEMHYTEAKRRVMSKQVEEHFAERVTERNIISIGDGVYEQHALAEIRTIEANRRRRAGMKVHLAIKSLRLMTAPSLDDLCDQLAILLAWLPRVVDYGGSFDASFEESGQIEELFAKLCADPVPAPRVDTVRRFQSCCRCQ